MSTLLFYDFRVGVIPRRDAQRVYVLFRYACFDEDAAVPEWSIAALGSFEEALRHIFRFAGSCEMGYVRGVHGPSLDPEGAVRLCCGALRAPFLVPEAVVELRVGSADGAMSPVRAARAGEALARGGFSAAARALEAGVLRLRLCQDIDALLALSGADGPLEPKQLPCQFIDNGELESARREPRRDGDVTMPAITCHALAAGAVLLRLGDAPLRYMDRRSAMRVFALDVACKLEHMRTGAGLAAIRRLRALLASAPSAEDVAVAIVLDDTAGSDCANESHARAIGAIFGAGGSSLVAGAFCARLAWLSSDVRAVVGTADDRVVQWSVPGAVRAPGA